MKLYLFENETADGEIGYVRYLDKIIALSRGCYTEETVTEIGCIKLTKSEIQELSNLSQEQIMGKLFAKFGITDLESYPGYPKGPYYWVDSEVYNAIRQRI